MWCLRNRAINISNRLSQLNKDVVLTRLFDEAKLDVLKNAKLTYSKWIKIKQFSDEKIAWNGIDRYFLHTQVICRAPHFNSTNRRRRLSEKYEESDEEHMLPSDEKKLLSSMENFNKNMTNPDANNGKKSLEDLKHAFKEPLNILNNFQSILGREIYKMHYKHITLSRKHKMKSHNATASWTCRLNLFYSDNHTFESIATTKTQTHNQVAFKALQWLYDNNHMTIKGQPIHSEEQLTSLKEGLNKPIAIELTSRDIQTIRELIDVFKNDIEPLLNKAEENFKKNQIKEESTILPSFESSEENELMENEENIHNWDYSSDNEFIDPIFGIAPQHKNKEATEKRSSYLYRNLQNRPRETSLPITSLRKNLIDTINSNRAIVISGAPGCGKSTRVPSYILDDWISQNEGGSCDILVSEPRRVAAISLAHRVASEREEKIGDVCGFQVRLSTQFSRPPGGAILFATAGCLLRRFSFTPDLPGCTHLIIDEAHERSAESDAVIALAKRAMSLNPNMKMIVMSATIDTNLFSRYLDDCPVFKIPGRTFEVKSHFLEDLPSDATARMNYTWDINTRHDARPGINAFDVSKMITWVHKNRPEGAILVFLPGWKEIKSVKELLEKNSYYKNYKVFPIHSKLSVYDQQQIFSHLPHGTRKIILATNIAETSITIDDILYVIDTGVHRENKMISVEGLSSLVTDWISKSSMNQRKGRAGRVQPGECFHMYTSDKMKSFEENSIPEILRVPLEKTILDAKIYNKDEKAIEFLQQFPEPPTLMAIESAVNNLIQIGALNRDENLTPLGKRIASFTTHPKISKALVHSAIFKVSNPVLDIATILSNNHEIFTFTPDNKEDMRDVKRSFHPTSDHQALHWINQSYQQIRQNKTRWDAEQFCKTRNIRKDRLDILRDLRSIYANHLYQCKMLDQYSHFSALNGNIDELVKGILLSGLNTMLSLRSNVSSTGKLAKKIYLINEKGQKAFASTDSVNNKIEKRRNSAILLYCGAMHSEERRGIVARDTSLLSPITAFLFSSQVKKIYWNEESVTFSLNEGKFAPKLECSSSSANDLVQFRNIIWSIFDYFIKHEGFVKSYNGLMGDDNDEDCKTDDNDAVIYKSVSNYRNLLLERLLEILSASEERILNVKIDKNE